MTKTQLKNGHDKPADQGVYAAAIAALLGELTTAEKRVAATKQLLSQLRAYTGIAADPPSAKRNDLETDMPGHIKLPAVKRRGRPPGRKSAAADAFSMVNPRSKPNGGAVGERKQARVKPGHKVKIASAVEFSKLVDQVALASQALAKAKVAKDAAAVKQTLTTIASAERSAGTILRLGTVRSKGMRADRIQRRRFRRAAELSPAQFQAKMKGTIEQAVMAMGAPLPSPSPKSKRPSEASPAHVKTRISKFQKDERGILTRTAVGIEQTSKDIAAAPAT